MDVLTNYNQDFAVDQSLFSDFTKYSLSLKLKNARSFSSQFFANPDFNIIGEYHGANLGDLALALAVESVINSNTNSSCLQTLHNLQFWPKHPYAKAIVGGGNVLSRDGLRQLYNRFSSDPKRLSIIGVEYTDEKDLLDYSSFLNDINLLTFRNSITAQKATMLLDRADIIWHPDLVFGLKSIVDRITPEKRSSEKVIGINILPLYLELRNGCFKNAHHPPDSFYHTSVQETQAYLKLITRLVSYYCERGFKLIHIPFAMEDDLFARSLLKGIKSVKFLPYSGSIERTFTLMKSCDLFVATRLHSLIFALLNQVPCIPISYAYKSLNLLHDLDITDFDPLFINSITDNPEPAFTCAISTPPLLIDQIILDAKYREVINIIQKAMLSA